MKQLLLKMTMSIMAFGISVDILGYDFKAGDIFYNIVSASDLTVEVTNDGNSNYNKLTGYYVGDVVIPASVNYSGKIYTVIGIGDNALIEHNGQGYRLSSIEMPNTIKYIGDGAFYNCMSLNKIVLSDNLESIGHNAFGAYYPEEQPNIKSIVIPANVSKIGINALSNKTKEVIMLPYNPPLGFSFGADNAEFIVPSKDKYVSNSNWSSYKLVEMLTPNSHDFIYNGQSPVVSWINNLKAYTIDLSEPFITGKDAGHYSVDMKVNYYKNGEIAFSLNFPFEYTINKAPLNVKANDNEREYGEGNPKFTYIYSGFVNNETETVINVEPLISTTATKTSNVGEYPITISGGEASNYEFVYEPGVLTVTKAPLSAKVADASKVYGSQNPAFTIEYYGLKNEEDAPAWTKRPTFQTDATQSSEVGQYEVKALNGVPVNYDLGDITSGTLSITPAPLTIKANDAARQYYSEEPAFSYTCKGFVNGDNESVFTTAPVLSTTASLNSNVGTYEIKVSDTSCQNYSVSHINGTLTITPRTLIASVGNYERLYNEENPVFEVKCDGFVGDEDDKVLRQKPTASTTATKSSDVGIYPINVTGGNADNYKFSYTTGTLTINKAEQTISWEQDLSGLKVGDQVELLARASSDLPVTYTMDNNNAAEIYSAGTKTYLDCKAGGQFLIRAVQNGNKNYYSSPRASNVVSIVGSNSSTDPVLNIKQADNGSISTQVSRGSVYTFTITPGKGWRIHTVTFNDEDVTNQLNSDKTFTTPAIHSNSTLSVVYEQGEDNAVSSTRQSDVKIQGMSFGIRVSNALTNDVIRVYSLDGILQKSITTEGQVTDIPLADGQVYIVKVGAKTVKLSL